MLAALCCLGYEPACWRSLWRFLDAAVEHDGDDQAWHLDCELTLPLAIELKKLTKTVEVLAPASKPPACDCWDQSRAIFPSDSTTSLSSTTIKPSFSRALRSNCSIT